jgi:two-component system NarL family sensor kinase
MTRLAAARLGLAVGTIAIALVQRDRMRSLEASRKRLAALAVDAGTCEQRRLSEGLHDTVLQTLAAARQDLAEAERGDEQSLRRSTTAVDTAIGQVREVVSDFHPAVAEQLGLGPALHALALRHARRSGFTIRVEAEREAAGIDDAFVLLIARELLANAAAHASATRVEIRVTLAGGDLRLVVTDDGCGFDDQARAAALRNGHIGLAASSERVEALGGRFVVTSSPGTGTTVRVTIPVGRERRRVARAGA